MDRHPEMSLECSGEKPAYQSVILGTGEEGPAELSSFIDYDANLFSSQPDARSASPPSVLPFATNQSQIPPPSAAPEPFGTNPFLVGGEEIKQESGEEEEQVFYAVDYDMAVDKPVAPPPVKKKEPPPAPKIAPISALNTSSQQTQRKKRRPKLDMQHEPVPVYECLFCAKESLVCAKKSERLLSSRYAGKTNPSAWGSVTWLLGRHMGAQFERENMWRGTFKLDIQAPVLRARLKTLEKARAAQQGFTVLAGDQSKLYLRALSSSLESKELPQKLVSPKPSFRDAQAHSFYQARRPRALPALSLSRIASGRRAEVCATARGAGQRLGGGGVQESGLMLKHLGDDELSFESEEHDIFAPQFSSSDEEPLLVNCQPSISRNASPHIAFSTQDPGPSNSTFPADPLSPQVPISITRCATVASGLKLAPSSSSSILRVAAEERNLPLQRAKIKLPSSKKLLVSQTGSRRVSVMHSRSSSAQKLGKPGESRVQRVAAAKVRLRGPQGQENARRESNNWKETPFCATVEDRPLRRASRSSSVSSPRRESSRMLVAVSSKQNFRTLQAGRVRGGEAKRGVQVWAVPSSASHLLKGRLKEKSHKKLIGAQIDNLHRASAMPKTATPNASHLDAGSSVKKKLKQSIWMDRTLGAAKPVKRRVLPAAWTEDELLGHSVAKKTPILEYKTEGALEEERSEVLLRGVKSLAKQGWRKY